MANGKSSAIIILLVSVITLCLVAYMVFISSSNGSGSDYRTEKNLAGELADNNLYQAAIDEYNTILTDRALDPETRANINYLIAKIYFDNLRDYENAAAHYVKARSLNQDGSFYAEAGKNLVASLEKMGRIVDAKRELDKSTNIDSVYAGHEGDKMVAKIGDVPIFLSQLNEEIQTLPTEAQKQFVGKEGKRLFLNQYIGMELMYRAAIREGMENDPDIAKKKEMLEKQLLIEKYAVEKVMPQINIDTTDMKNYYKANKDGKFEGKPYDEVKAQVLMSYQQEKAQQAFGEYVAKLSAAENVKIFEENVK
ncbi:MAG: hypothetical protein CVT49_01225 [candidate division Zixibacteria bacterium HGW-Zixibacteria-1]|nr:MAG: hypothetical protein CVT49_01225 [candidate division Zixibacteria bacterium HGW-Zixibacteria-1]